MHSRPIAASAILLASAITTPLSVNGTPTPNATVELAPRQSGISALQCTLQGSLVQCCQTFEPFSDVTDTVEPILDALGIPLPGLGTFVAFDCQSTVLGIGCTESTLCCTTVIPNQNIGINCVPVDPIL